MLQKRDFWTRWDDVTNTYGSGQEVKSGDIEMDSNQFEIFRYDLFIFMF